MDSNHLGGMMTQQIKRIFSSRAAGFYAIVWISSLVYLVSRGNGVFGSIAFGLGVLLFCGFTVLITREVDDLPAESQNPNPRRWIQLIIVLFFVALTGFGGFMFNARPGQPVHIPVWSPVANWFGQLGAKFLGDLVDHSPALAAANLARYVLIPLVLLLISGARLSGLGFAKGHRVWQVITIWVSIPLILFVAQIFSGATTLASLAKMFFGNFLRNGFSEEFLFRGALQTRLRASMNSEWALVIQALLFGIWHLGFDTQTMGGDVLQGLALGIASHSISGLAMGVIFRRTRNLIAPSVVHIVINMFGT
jgi:membrane protease YdiL (CAAX protease family)